MFDGRLKASVHVGCLVYVFLIEDSGNSIKASEYVYLVKSSLRQLNSRSGLLS